MLTRTCVCVGMGAARLAELRLSRSHIVASEDVREGPWSRRTYPLIVALHVTVIVITLFRGTRTKWMWLLLLFAVQPVRVWTIATLGTRWNTRAAVPADLVVETSGPYRYIRHPNYLVVFVELLALPLAFGLERFALLAGALHVPILAIRIRDEEQLLLRDSDYASHFRGKKRFVPRIF